MALMEELIEKYHQSNAMQTQRIANIFLDILEKNPSELAPYLGLMLDTITNGQSTDAVKRNTTRIFKEMKQIPDDLLGQLTSLCFDFASSPSEAIAVRAFSMHILKRISKIEPDILPELYLVVEDAMRNGSPGIRSIGSKILKGR
jgi:hypothetical protein